jgi:hypothetical protein
VSALAVRPRGVTGVLPDEVELASDRIDGRSDVEVGPLLYATV